MYTAGPAIGPGTTQGYYNASYTPGSLISFLVRAKNDPFGCYTGSPLDTNEASRVMLEITGTNGNTFYMVGNRAVALNDISYSTAQLFQPPGAPGVYCYMQYRGIAWQIPAFMPAGTYRARLYAFPNGSATPQFLTTPGVTIAECPLTITGQPGPGQTSLSYRPNSPAPTASSPVFDLQWPVGAIPNNPNGGQTGSGPPTAVRATIRNVATNRYYCLSNSDWWYEGGINNVWDANLPYSNSSSISVRYNSASLFGDVAPARIPAGTYQVYLDGLNVGNNPVVWLTTPSSLPFITLP